METNMYFLKSWIWFHLHPFKLLLHAIKASISVYLPETLSAKIFSGIKSNILYLDNKLPILNAKEKTFLSLLCKELSYQEIAERMFISPRTVDDYRKKLSKKLDVKGKSGLIVYAMNNGLNQG